MAPAPPPAETQPEDGPFWFTVKYGKDQQEIFNSDCWACVLYDHIKRTCGYFDMQEEIDLQREDGSRLELGSVGRERAYGTVASKGTYILVKLIEPEEEGGAPTVEPLYEPPEGGEIPVAADPKGKKK